MTAAYPNHIRTILRAGKSRRQPAAFSLAEPRRGFAYVREIGTDTPVFWDVEFRFTPAEALVFRLWFANTIRRGIDEFTMPIRTEFGLITHTCRFLPDSLMDTSESGETFGYRATIMARAEVIPSDYMAASDLIVALPDWTSWAGLLDQTVTAEMPRADGWDGLGSWDGVESWDD